MRPADSCNPHFKDEHPCSLGIPTRLRSKLRAADELYASTTLGPLRPACPAEPGGHCRPTRSDQGLTSDVASPSGHCSRGFKAHGASSVRSRSLPPLPVEGRRLSRSTTPSIGGELFRALLWSRCHEGCDPGLGALSPVAGSPLRARSFPPLSATTESGFRGPTPPADFCNQSTEQGHTRQPTIPRAELAFSTLSVCLEPVKAEAASGTAPDLSVRFGAG